jgi:hypothetical protein
VTSIGRRLSDGARTFPWSQAVVAAFAVVYIVFAAKALMGVQDESGDVKVAIPLVIAFMPICAYLTYRFPLIFPFGLYVALTPVDALLTVSGGSSLVRFVGIFAAAALGFRILITRQVLSPPPAWYAWGALILYAAASLLWSPDLAHGSTTLGSMVMLFIMMTVVALYKPTMIEFKVAIGLFVPCALGMAFYSLHQYYSGMLSSADSRLSLQVGTTYSLDVNYLAGAFLPGIAIALTGVFYTKNLFLRWGCALATLPMMAAIFVTGSRSAAIAAIVIFAYFAIRSKKYVQVLLIAGMALALMVIYPRVLDRMFDQTLANGSGRLDIWETGMHSFGDHWLFGAGVGSYSYNYDHNFLQVFQHEFSGWSRPGHSIIFVGLSDFGVVGFALVAFAWYMSFRQLHVIPRSSGLFGIRLGCEAAIIGLLIQMLFIDPYYIKYVWLAHTLPLLVLNVYAPRALRVGGGVARSYQRLRPAWPLRGT